MEWWMNSTIPDMLWRLKRNTGSRLAIVFGEKSVSFSELAEQASRIAANLVQLGVEPGDRVAILMPPSDAWAAVHYGVIISGAILVPVNLAFKVRELSYVLRQSGARCVITSERFRDMSLKQRVEEIIPELAASFMTGVIESRQCPCVRWGILHSDGLATPGSWLSLNDMIHKDASAAAQERLEARMAALKPNSSCCIVYTSGSTGFPKPALLHHRGIIGGGWAYGQCLGVQEDDKVLIPWPTFHVSGINAGMMIPHLHGLPAWLMEAYEPAQALDIIERVGITLFSGFDTTFTTLLGHREFRRERVASVKRLLLATGPAMYDRVFKQFPKLEVASKCYSMTETCGPSALMFPNVVDPHCRKYGHGLPIAGVQIRIMDPTTNSPAVTGERGEIRVRGWNLFNGYYQMEEETRGAFDAEDWFKTGDIGRIDEYGVLYFEGRYKRMIKTGGENVSEREVESILEDKVHGVNIAQVVGVPDPLWGEAVVAFIEAVPGWSLSEDEVKRICKEEMANFKVPKRVLFVSDSEWPRNDVGKVSKDALVTMAIERLGIGAAVQKSGIE